MSDLLLFSLIFGGLLVLRINMATVLVALILPAGDHCLNCDAQTIRVSSALDRICPWFRRSWCLRCGWHGVLRRGAINEEPKLSETVSRR
jgi:hypothetical protein